jgi:hypothetical protein
MVFFDLLILHIKIYVRLITFSDDFSVVANFIIIATMRATECWVNTVRHHHCRAGPPPSPLDGALGFPSQNTVKSANLQSN